MKRLLLGLVPLLLALSACIQDDVLEDYVDPELRITNAIDSLTVDSSFQLAVRYLDAIGRAAEVNPVWTSDAPNVATVQNGRVTGRAPGTARISTSYDDRLARNGTPEDGFTLTVVAAPIIVDTTTTDPPPTARGTVETTTFYDLEGAFTMEEHEDGGLLLRFGDDYVADDNLPGLYLYLTNNPNSVADALEVGPVTVFTGAHEYDIPEAGVADYRYLLYYCKPFRVKVGDGEIKVDE